MLKTAVRSSTHANFEQYVKDNPRTTNAVEDKIAYLLPKDYGYGFRGPNDKIWGL